MFLVYFEELRINHLTPLLVVTMPYTCWFLWRANYIENFKWCLHFQFGVVFWRAILRGIFWRAKSRLKGIEDFNLEHCPLWLLQALLLQWSWNKNDANCSQPFNRIYYEEITKMLMLHGIIIWFHNTTTNCRFFSFNAFYILH